MAHRWDPKAPHPGRLVLPVRIDRDGGSGPTPAQVRGPHWRSTSYGFHVPADTPIDVPEQWIAEASVRLPPGGRITGWAACRLHEANFFDGLDRDGSTRITIPVAIGPRGRVRHRNGLRVLHWEVPIQHRDTRHGLATVDELWATADAARLAGSLIEAVVVIDMMCAAQVVSIRQLRESALWFAPGVLDAASEHSRSPNETRCRLQCRVALPGVRWIVNCPIHDLSGRLMGIADLVDLEAGLVVEFDGADHREGARHTRDVVKEDAFRRAGIEVVRVTGSEVDNEAVVTGRVRAGRERAKFEPEVERRWVARPPADTLHDLIEERDFMRSLVSER